MSFLLRVVLTVLLSLAMAAAGAALGAHWLINAGLASIGAALAQWLYLQGVIRPLREATVRTRAMQQHRSLVRSFVDNAPVVMAIKDREGRYLTANAEFERLHGVTADELQGKADEHFMPASIANTVRSNDQKVLESGHSLVYQVPMRTLDGWRQMEAIKFPLYGSDHQISGLGLVATDVTEREASYEKFLRVFEASPNWIVITRLADGVVIDANDGFERISGHSRTTAIGHPISALNIWVHPEQRATIVDQLLREGRVHEVKAQLRRRDGEVRDCVANAALISLEGQTNSHAVWIARDVTEEQAAHEQFVAAFRLTPNFMSISKASDGRYVEVNEAFERFTGRRREQVIGRTSVDIGLWHNPEERQAMIKLIERDREVRDFEVHLCDEQGRVHVGLAYATIFETRGERYMIAMMQDVTEAQLAEKALRESEARFSNLFEMSPLPMSYSFDSDLYATSHRNAAFYTLFGYPRETSGARSAAELGFWVDPRDGEKARQLRLSAEPINNWQVEVRCADGSHRWVSIFGRVIVEPHRKMVITTLFDITEQRRIQREIEDLNAGLEDRVRERTAQLQAANAELSQTLQALSQTQDHLVQSEKLAALGALVAGVAHELNTPIGNGLTVASSLEDKAQSFAAAAAQPLQRSTLMQFLDDTRFAADILVRNLTRAATLISSFKQVAVDRTSSQRRPFDLCDLVDESVMTLSPTIRHSGCEVVSGVAPGLAMDSYPGPLGQVLTNLITNALVHGFPAGQRGRIDISASALGSNEVEISVRDNGGGIDAAHLRRVFEPFFTTRLGQGGSGLGLHIVHNIVTGILGGRIDLHSDLGQGAQFVLRLPVSAPVPPQADEADS